MKAWHFTNEKLRDGRDIPVIGEWLEHKGKVIPCQSGLHASLEPWDALTYAPGNILHLVELEGEIVFHENDKIVGRRRKIIASFDIENLLRKFACQQALKVARFWDMPKIVRDYLETQSESLRDAARAAAWAAARAAAEAAWDAARAAAEAAWDAARDAARDAQRKEFNSLIYNLFSEHLK